MVGTIRNQKDTRRNGKRKRTERDTRVIWNLSSPILNTDKKFFRSRLRCRCWIHSVPSMKPWNRNWVNCSTKYRRAKFEIRETEKFREASASANTIRNTGWIKTRNILYTHSRSEKSSTLSVWKICFYEAIPDITIRYLLAQETNHFPEFRRFLIYGAYVEGWALVLNP